MCDTCCQMCPTPLFHENLFFGIWPLHGRAHVRSGTVRNSGLSSARSRICEAPLRAASRPGNGRGVTPNSLLSPRARRGIRRHTQSRGFGLDAGSGMCPRKRVPEGDTGGGAPPLPKAFPGLRAGTHLHPPRTAASANGPRRGRPGEHKTVMHGLHAGSSDTLRPLFSAGWLIGEAPRRIVSGKHNSESGIAPYFVTSQGRLQMRQTPQ